MLKDNTLILVSFFLALFISQIHQVQAEQTNRANRWEGSVQLAKNESSTFNGLGGSSIEMDSDLGWGFTLGYNIDEHFLVSFDWLYFTPDYQANIVHENGNIFTFDHTLDLSQTQLTGVYHFFAEDFTPYVQAGLGWSYMDSNIADGPPQDVCWWHPWWGYICNSYQNTYDESEFSYHLGVGVRYEIDKAVFIKASYKHIWVDLSNVSDADYGYLGFEIGTTF